jgi:hypothetical protein
VLAAERQEAHQANGMMSRSAKAPDDQTKLKKILDELTKKEENKFCADCGCRGMLDVSNTIRSNVGRPDHANKTN